MAPVLSTKLFIYTWPMSQCQHISLILYASCKVQIRSKSCTAGAMFCTPGGRSCCTACNLAWLHHGRASSATPCLHATVLVSAQSGGVSTHACGNRSSSAEAEHCMQRLSALYRVSAAGRVRFQHACLTAGQARFQHACL